MPRDHPASRRRTRRRPTPGVPDPIPRSPNTFYRELRCCRGCHGENYARTRNAFLGTGRSSFPARGRYRSSGDTSPSRAAATGHRYISDIICSCLADFSIHTAAPGRHSAAVEILFLLIFREKFHLLRMPLDNTFSDVLSLKLFG